MDKFKSSLLRKLKSQCKDLSEDLEYCESVFNVAVVDFCDSVGKFCRRYRKKNPLEDLTSKKNEDKKHSIDREFKNIFREIAKKTHSDLTKSDESRPLLEKAVQAKKDNDSAELISIASKLNININELSYKNIDSLNDSIADLEKKILNITMSYPWVWYHSPSSKKEKIIREFISSKV